MADEFDALVAAPAFHRLAFEDETVRVLETRIEPGQVVPPHTHKWRSLNYVLSSSDFVRRDGEGNVLLDSRVAGNQLPIGSVFWSDSLPLHSLENVGDQAIHVISIEQKD